jgi:hypothetical protein
MQGSPRHRQPIRLLWIALFCLSIGRVGSGAQRPERRAPPGEPAVVEGTITTQGSIALPGATVTMARDGVEVARVGTDGGGKFRFDGVMPGAYLVSAVLEGFDALTASVTVAAGQTAAMSLDLKIAALTDRVDVVAPTTVVPSTGTLTAAEGLTRRELEEITGGGGFQSALRLLVSVIEVPGGLAIKGGRPSQATTQLGPGAFVDPATGLSMVELPDDAIESVTVLPNPYAVEYGRFSSGLVLIRTRRATDEWRTRINKLDPAFLPVRGSAFHVVGLASFSPRFETGGALVKDRVYLQQAAQYRYRASDVPSRPQDELRTSHRFSSFTRLDANLSPKHLLVAAGGWFPASAKQATLGTFTPPPATVNTRGQVNTVSMTERSLWSDTVFSETTVEVHGYETTVIPRGTDVMQLLPETTLGSFFNRQHRATNTYQVIESVSGTHYGHGGLHLFKAGVDVLYSRFRGTSASRPVLIRRTDGSLARRLDVEPVQSSQRLDSTDLALFVQDRIQPTERWYLEIGARLDRDGAIRRVNLTPRLGLAFLLNAAGTSVLRGGYGRFFERTPSVAGVFNQYEPYLDTRFAADGATPLGPPLLFTRTAAPELQTARSLTWDVGLDHRLNTAWAIRAALIDRRGSNELIVSPAQTSTGPSILLASSGRSSYHEAEVGAHYTGRPGMDLNVSYVFSRGRADLNSLTTYYDNVLSPVVGETGYGRARTDVPHRFLARGRATPVRDWLLVGVLDWRTGLPYSVVDEWLDFVGPRNDRRFPNYVRVDFGVEHRFKFGKYRPWIGVRADNALSSFLPMDVQANRSSPAFGTFYNAEYRQFRIQVRFES